MGVSRRSAHESVTTGSLVADIGISTVIRPHEDPVRVIESIRGLFPEWETDSKLESSEFPQTRREIVLEGGVDSLDKLLETARDQRILDTALDAMSIRLDGDYTEFAISRQASMVGKLSFVLDDRPLGGEIVVRIRMQGLSEWLERSTWHLGRDSVPRAIGDGLGMSEEGEPVEWFDKRGNPTMSDD